MTILSTPVSLHRSARRARRCSNASWTDVTADMDPEGFSLSDLAFEMEEEYAVSHDDVCAPLEPSACRHPASDGPPPPLPKPLASEKPAPRAFVSSFYAPSTSSESPVDVTDDAWINYGAGSTPGVHC